MHVHVSSSFLCSDVQLFSGKKPLKMDGCVHLIWELPNEQKTCFCFRCIKIERSPFKALWITLCGTKISPPKAFLEFWCFLVPWRLNANRQNVRFGNDFIKGEILGTLPSSCSPNIVTSYCPIQPFYTPLYTWYTLDIHLGYSPNLNYSTSKVVRCCCRLHRRGVEGSSSQGS